MCSVDVVWRLWNWSGLAKFESLKEKIDKRRANLCLGASLLGFKIPTGDMRNERENYLSIRQRKGECGLHLSKLSEWYSFRFWITLPWWHLCGRSFSWGEPPQSTQKLSSRHQPWKPICWVRFLLHQLVSSPSSQPTHKLEPGIDNYFVSYFFNFQRHLLGTEWTTLIFKQMHIERNFVHLPRTRTIFYQRARSVTFRAW